MNKTIFFGHNYTSVNWGCRATPEALLELISPNFDIVKTVSNSQLLKMNDIEKLIKGYDSVIINGEGSPIFTTPPRKEFLKHLEVLTTAQKNGIKTYYLNTMFSKCPIGGINQETFKFAVEIFQKTNSFILRDVESYNFAKKFIKHAQYIPDALFSWADKKEILESVSRENFDISSLPKRYICFSGGSWPKPYSHPVDTKKKQAKEILRDIKKMGLEIVLVETCGADKWLKEVAKELNLFHVPVNTYLNQGKKILENADIFISGRFHPSILASNGGTPCIFFQSNSHKTKSLQKVLEYDEVKVFSIPFKKSEFSELLNLVENYLNKNSFYKEKIKNKCLNLSKLSKEGYSLIK